MKQKKIVAGAAALLMLFLAVGVFFIVGQDKQPRLDVISRKDALEDYDYLWDTLEKNYPFLGVAQRKYGMDVQQLKQNYRQQLESMEKEIDFLEFYHLMEDGMSRFHGLGHAGMTSVESMQAFFIVDRAQSGNHSDWRIEHVLSEESVQQRYQFLQDAQSASVSQMPEQNRLIFDRFPSGIAYLKISSFAGEYVQQDHQPILEFFQENADAPYLLIDIRGNGGGSSAYWANNIVGPNLEEEQFAPYLYLTPYGEQSQLFMNNDILQRSELQNNLDELQKLSEINQDDLASGWYWGKDAYYAAPQLEEKVFKGKIFLLVDSSTASAADALAYFCKKTGFATVIGAENAVGSGLGGNHVMEKLPNSNLVFQYRPVQALNLDGSGIEEFGIAPDVLLPSQAKYTNDKVSPLGACRAYIEGLEE